MLTSRLCQLMIGKRAFKSVAIGQFLDDQDALTHFVVSTGLKKVGTVDVAHRLIEWGRQHDVSMRLVSAAGPFFDVEQPGFKRKPPGSAHQISFFTAATVCTYVALIAFTLALTMPPLIRVIKTDTWYAIAPEGTFKFNLWHQDKPKFSLERCENKAALGKETGYPGYDIDVLCDAFGKGAGKPQLHDAQVGQWVIAIFVLVPMSLFALLFFRIAGQASKASRLYKKLSDLDGDTASS